MQLEIILLEKVSNLGELGDIVRVRSGYARNCLIPQGKAKLATPENVEEFKQHRAHLEESSQARLQQAEERKQKIDGLELTVRVRISSGGTLFGSVGASEIIDAIKESSGEQIEKSEVYLGSGALRELGEHSVSLRFHPGVHATVRLNIIAES